MQNQNPLISCCMLVYNNEKHIRDAVLSALGQTYSPLEIIISDDSSIDRSYEIVQEILADYKGPHKIQLNRNNKNLGICGQINKLVSLATGDFLVIFAGDDISKPERVEKIQHHIADTDISFVTSEYYLLDDEIGEKKLVRSWNINTRDIHKFLSRQYVMGATESFSKDLYKVFGELNEDNCIEDLALAFRAFLLKRVSFLYEPTIEYRVHNSNFSTAKNLSRDHQDIKKQFDKWYPAHEILFKQYSADLNTAYEKGIVSSQEYEQIKYKLDRLRNRNEVSYQLDLYWLKSLQNGNFLKLFFSAVKAGLPLKFIIWRFIKRIKSGYNL